jgi:hypothetical protein
VVDRLFEGGVMSLAVCVELIVGSEGREGTVALKVDEILNGVCIRDRTLLA